MAIRDYWIYQKRNVTTPWALYVVKEFDKRGDYKASITIDYTFYHEDVPKPTRSFSVVGLHYDTIKAYADAITAEIVPYCEVDYQDYQQIYNAIEEIILN